MANSESRVPLWNGGRREPISDYWYDVLYCVAEYVPSPTKLALRLGIQGAEADILGTGIVTLDDRGTPEKSKSVELMRMFLEKPEVHAKMEYLCGILSCYADCHGAVDVLHGAAELDRKMCTLIQIDHLARRANGSVDYTNPPKDETLYPIPSTMDDMFQLKGAGEVSFNQNDGPQQTNDGVNRVECPQEFAVKILPVRIYYVGEGRAERSKTINAFLDNGSDKCYIRESLTDELGLPSRETSMNITTLNNSERIKTKEVKLTMSGMESEKKFELTAFTMQTIWEGFKVIDWNKHRLKHEHLAGIEFHRPVSGNVDVLIGINQPRFHASLEERRGSPDEPIAQRGILGWTCIGPCPPPVVRRVATYFKRRGRQRKIRAGKQWNWALLHSGVDRNVGGSFKERKQLGVQEETINMWRRTQWRRSSGDHHHADDHYGDDHHADDHYGDDHHADDHYGDDHYRDDLRGDDHYGDNLCGAGP